MQTRWIVFALLVACGGESKKSPDVGTGSGSGSAPAPVEAPRTGPHSGAIERIAITDDGAVAYTIDTFGQARLWLSLDGTREPVIVRGGRAIRVSLGRIDDGFVAALLDEAGGIELVRFDRDGSTRGHVSLAPDPGFTDVLAVEGGVLARRRDEFLVWYDAGGHKRGQIAADPGERITGLAVRRGRTIAALVGADGPGISLRWITFGTTIEWGTRQKLKGDVIAPIALSPDGTKIAGIAAATKRFEIVDLTTGEGMYAKSADSMVVSDAPAMGFLDDHTAVFSDTRGTTWWALAQKDPWATSQRGTPSDSSDVAVGDHVMLDSSSTSLTLTTETSMKYLGYRDIGPAVMWSMQDGIATQRGTNSVWLDRELRERVTKVAPAAQVSAIVGDHHLVISEASRIYLFDTETKEEKTIGTYQEAAGAVFDASSGVLFVSTQTRTERFAISLVPTLSITPLPALALEKDGTQVTAMDPKTADGIIAVVSAHELDGSVRLDWYREPAAGETVVKRVGSTPIDNEAMPIGADKRGVVYFVDRIQARLRMIQLDRPIRSVAITGEVSTAVPTPDGMFVIVATADEVFAMGTSEGTRLWRLPIPGIDTLKFSLDGKTLFTSARGGVVSIEPTTGTRIATACGWNFGLHDDQVSAQVFGVPNLCAGIE